MNAPVVAPPEPLSRVGSRVVSRNMEERVVVFGNDAPPLLVGPDGRPLTEVVVEFVGFKPVHLFAQARLVCEFRRIDGEHEILRIYFKVDCSCEKRFPSYPCQTWKPKGVSSNLARAAAVAYGRPFHKGDRADPKSIFNGKLLVAEVVVVNRDRDGRCLPKESWYSKIGSFTRLEAGGVKR